MTEAGEALVERLPVFFASRFGNDGTAELHFWSGSRTMLIKAADSPSAAPYGMRHAVQSSACGRNVTWAPPVLPSILKLPTRRKKCARIRLVSWL